MSEVLKILGPSLAGAGSEMHARSCGVPAPQPPPADIRGPHEEIVGAPGAFSHGASRRGSGAGSFAPTAWLGEERWPGSAHWRQLWGE